ncbi:AraC family transcriptional regulator [Kushneria aurantia]|uniref:AraC family transcriptional regulator N-terminal domain-containing protein n=1 Tax=Kushneria aurantia TaxID=504092 RepID=A0ABV6G0V1_9GAMM|nr:AraC family transcriptional regulator [Kushneria aurantia]
MTTLMRDTSGDAPALAAQRDALPPMQRELPVLLDRLTAGRDGKHRSAIAGLTLNRLSAPRPPRHVIQAPVFSVIAQGSKRLSLGEALYGYDPLHYMVSPVDLPVMAQVDDASRSRPYLGLRLDLDLDMLDGLVSAMPPAVGGGAETPRGLHVAALNAPLLDAVLRLLRLLEQPADIAVLAPLYKREILYRLISGEQGAALAAMVVRDSHAARVRAAVALLRERCDRGISMAELARSVNMSVSSLHHHFRAVTSMSPLQFHKRVRLEEARRLLLGGGLEMAIIARRVGYESPSQFSREYRRLFGFSPREDQRRWRAMARGEKQIGGVG